MAARRERDAGLPSVKSVEGSLFSRKVSSMIVLWHSIAFENIKMVDQVPFSRYYAVVTPACKLPVFLLHYVIAEKGVGHAIYGEEGRTVCRGIVQG